jgi:hypothetical protein
MPKEAADAMRIHPAAGLGGMRTGGGERRGTVWKWVGASRLRKFQLKFDLVSRRSIAQTTSECR